MLKALCISLSLLLAIAAEAGSKRNADTADVRLNIVSIRPAGDSALRLKLEISNQSTRPYYVAACDSPARISEIYSRIESAEPNGTWKNVLPVGQPSIDEGTEWWVAVPAGGTLNIDYVFTPALLNIHPGSNARIIVLARNRQPSGEGKREQTSISVDSPAFVVLDPQIKSSRRSRAIASTGMK